METTIELLQKQIDLISQLRDLPSSEHPKFKEWEQLTNAIIEKRLGKDKKNLNYCNFWPNRIGPWEGEELKQALNEGLDSAEALLKALIQEVEILGEETLSNNSPFPSSKTYPKLKFGEPGRSGQPGSGGSIFIQAENFNMSRGERISADGGNNVIHLNELNNFGTINQTIVEAVNNISKLTHIVSQSNLDETKKRQLIGDIETIKAQIIKPTPDKTILQKVWDAVQVVSTIGGAAQLLRSIGQVILPLLK